MLRFNKISLLYRYHSKRGVRLGVERRPKDRVKKTGCDFVDFSNGNENEREKNLEIP
jgi:hypothetical protein